MCRNVKIYYKNISGEKITGMPDNKENDKITNIKSVPGTLGRESIKNRDAVFSLRKMMN